MDNGESRGRVGGGRKEVARATTGKSLARAGKPTVRKIERHGKTPEALLAAFPNVYPLTAALAAFKRRFRKR